MKKVLIWLMLIVLVVPFPVMAQEDIVSCKQGDTFEVIFSLTPDSECPDGIMGQLEYDNQIFIPVSPNTTMRRNKNGSMNAFVFISDSKTISVSFQVNSYAPDGLYSIGIKVLEAAYADGRLTDQVKIKPVQVRIGAASTHLSSPTPSLSPNLTPIPTPKSTIIEPTTIVGSHITFGHYPQSSSGTDNTPIEWTVLDIDKASNKALLISRYSLDSKPYNSTENNVTWETCSLRSWLNFDFLNTAFSKEEQEAILLTNVDNSKKQNFWQGENGVNTLDKIFLLSYTEAWNYFLDSRAKRCAPTEYAIQVGASAASYTNIGLAGDWWLRSSNGSSRATSVDGTGKRQESNIEFEHIAVRPAIWVALTTLLSSPTIEPSPKPTPTPTVSPISVAEVSYKGGGTVEISWEGGTKSTWAYVYHWFNEQYNNNVTKCLVNEHPWVLGSNSRSNYINGNIGTIDQLVPGQRYWIVLTDSFENSSGNAIWVDFKVPKGSKLDVNISMNKVDFYTNTEDYSWKIVDNVTAGRIEKTCRNSPKYDDKAKHLWLTPSYNINGLLGEKTLQFVYVLILPNGDVFTNGGVDVKVKNGSGSYMHGFSWEKLYEAYDCIPSGTYTFVFIVNDYIVGTKKITL